MDFALVARQPLTSVASVGRGCRTEMSNGDAKCALPPHEKDRHSGMRWSLPVFGGTQEL